MKENVNQKIPNNINIQVNPQINVYGGSSDYPSSTFPEVNDPAMDKIIEFYENINFITLRDSLSLGKPRKTFYKLDCSFKKNMFDIILCDIDRDKYLYLYQKYIENLIDTDISYCNYETLIDECMSNISNLFSYLKSLKELYINRELKNYTLYCILIHNATIALIGEYNKYKILRDDKIEKVRISTGRNL